MSPYFLFLDLLTIPAFFIGSFYSFLASVSAFAAIFVTLKAVKFLAN